MRKIMLALLCMAALVMSGCGDKFAKEKEAIVKAEKAAMAMELPVVERPDFSGQPRLAWEERRKIWGRYREELNKLTAAEDKILAEMRRSDARIAEMEKKAESDSDWKELREFKDKVRKERIDFVRKISRGRLFGDTFIAGVGSTWQEVEMVYGAPLNPQEKYRGTKIYRYDGIEFEDHIGGGVPPKEKLMKWKSLEVQSVMVTGGDITSDAGVRIGMTRGEVIDIWKSKYVKKRDYQRNEIMDSHAVANGIVIESNMVVQYSLKETLPCHVWLDLKNGKVSRYVVSNGVL